MIIENFEYIKELPESDLALAKFEEEGKTKYKFTLQMPSYIAFMTYCTSREKKKSCIRLTQQEHLKMEK